MHIMADNGGALGRASNRSGSIQGRPQPFSADDINPQTLHTVASQWLLMPISSTVTSSLPSIINDRAAAQESCAWLHPSTNAAPAHPPPTRGSIDLRNMKRSQIQSTASTYNAVRNIPEQPVQAMLETALDGLEPLPEAWRAYPKTVGGQPVWNDFRKALAKLRRLTARLSKAGHKVSGSGTAPPPPPGPPPPPPPPSSTTDRELRRKPPRERHDPTDKPSDSRDTREARSRDDQGRREKRKGGNADHPMTPDKKRPMTSKPRHRSSQADQATPTSPARRSSPALTRSTRGTPKSRDTAVTAQPATAAASNGRGASAGAVVPATQPALVTTSNGHTAGGDAPAAARTVSTSTPRPASSPAALKQDQREAADGAAGTSSHDVMMLSSDSAGPTPAPSLPHSVFITSSFTQPVAMYPDPLTYKHSPCYQFNTLLSQFLGVDAHLPLLFPGAPLLHLSNLMLHVSVLHAQSSAPGGTRNQSPDDWAGLAVTLQDRRSVGPALAAIYAHYLAPVAEGMAAEGVGLQGFEALQDLVPVYEQVRQTVMAWMELKVAERMEEHASLQRPTCGCVSARADVAYHALRDWQASELGGQDDSLSKAALNLAREAARDPAAYAASLQHAARAGSLPSHKQLYGASSLSKQSSVSGARATSGGGGVDSRQRGRQAGDVQQDRQHAVNETCCQLLLSWRQSKAGLPGSGAPCPDLKRLFQQSRLSKQTLVDSASVDMDASPKSAAGVEVDLQPSLKPRLSRPLGQRRSK